MSADLSGQRLGHYVVQGVLGRGGMSVVYRAVDHRLDRSVALKVMSENLSADDEFRARFVGEAKAASAIDHVNVVPIYDFGEQDGRLFIAMRLVEGTDLARELAAGPLPNRRVLQLLGQVGAALDVLHERGLVHLDVKPANVLITRNESSGTEHVYLADFGLTRRDPTGHRTLGGDFLGSPTYASPEHLRGRPVLPSADEYSLTCMLFTALAGRPPFVGDVRTVITGHLAGTVPSLSALSGLPPAIDRVIAKGMAAEPEIRYGTSSDLLVAAKRALSDHSEPSTPNNGTGRSSTSMTGPGPLVPPSPATRVTTAAESTAPVPRAPVPSPAFPLPSPPVHPDPRGHVPVPAPVPSMGYRPPTSRPSPPQWPAQPMSVPQPSGPPIPATSHRISPTRPLWPWLVGVVVVVAIAAVVLVLIVRG